MKLIRLLTVLVATMSLVAVLIPSAMASDATRSMRAARGEALAADVFTADDPRAAFESLSAEDQDIVEEFATVVSDETIEVDVVAVPSTEVTDYTTDLAARCWRSTWFVDGKNSFGGVLYRYYLTATWCAQNGQVYYGRMDDRWGETYYPGWRFNGHIGGMHTITNNQYRIYTQGKFTLGSGGWDVQTRTPCLQIRGNANGTVRGLASCNLN